MACNGDNCLQVGMICSIFFIKYILRIEYLLQYIRNSIWLDAQIGQSLLTLGIWSYLPVWILSLWLATCTKRSCKKNLSDWLTVNKLQFHPLKTKLMVVGSTYNLNTKSRELSNVISIDIAIWFHAYPLTNVWESYKMKSLHLKLILIIYVKRHVLAFIYRSFKKN